MAQLGLAHGISISSSCRGPVAAIPRCSVAPVCHQQRQWVAQGCSISTSAASTNSRSTVAAPAQQRRGHSSRRGQVIARAGEGAWPGCRGKTFVSEPFRGAPILLLFLCPATAGPEHTPGAYPWDESEYHRCGKGACSCSLDPTTFCAGLQQGPYCCAAVLLCPAGWSL